MNIVSLFGKKWRDQNGNTYHTVTIYFNAEWYGISPVTYGYGNEFERTGFDLLQKRLAFKGRGLGKHRIVSESCYVARKKDL